MADMVFGGRWFLNDIGTRFQVRLTAHRAPLVSPAKVSIAYAAAARRRIKRGNERRGDNPLPTS